MPDYFPFPLLLNYLTMVCIILFIVSAVICKYDKLAYLLMALYVFLMALLVHLPRAMGYELDSQTMMSMIDREREIEMVNIFRNVMVCGALLGFGRFVARDNRIIG